MSDDTWRSCPDCYDADGYPIITTLYGRCRRCHGTGRIPLTGPSVILEDYRIQIEAAAKSVEMGFYATAIAELRGAILMLKELDDRRYRPASASQIVTSSPSGAST
jgi:hypothetical protein